MEIENFAISVFGQISFMVILRGFTQFITGWRFLKNF